MGTKEFAEAVVKCLGEKPKHLPTVSYTHARKFETLKPSHLPAAVKRECVGVDMFIYSKEKMRAFESISDSKAWAPLALQMISNRGVRVWPEGHPETFCVDQWRLRFTHEG